MRNYFWLFKIYDFFFFFDFINNLNKFNFFKIKRIKFFTIMSFNLDLNINFFFIVWLIVLNIVIKIQTLFNPYLTTIINGPFFITQNSQCLLLNLISSTGREFPLPTSLIPSFNSKLWLSPPSDTHTNFATTYIVFHSISTKKKKKKK